MQKVVQLVVVVIITIQIKKSYQIMPQKNKIVVQSFVGGLIEISNNQNYSKNQFKPKFARFF